MGQGDWVTIKVPRGAYEEALRLKDLLFRKGTKLLPAPLRPEGSLTIGHVFTDPFYDCSYAFGLLLVLGLYQRYKEEGEAFVPRYLKILAYGGSKAPIAVLDEAGFDVRVREFWQGGFDVLAGMIDELESLQ